MPPWSLGLHLIGEGSEVWDSRPISHCPYCEGENQETISLSGTSSSSIEDGQLPVLGLCLNYHLNCWVLVYSAEILTSLDLGEPPSLARSKPAGTVPMVLKGRGRSEAYDGAVGTILLMRIGLTLEQPTLSTDALHRLDDLDARFKTHCEASHKDYMPHMKLFVRLGGLGDHLRRARVEKYLGDLARRE